MILKERYESLELKIFRALHNRMELSPKDVTCYLNLEKGFKGELQFDKWLENLPHDWILLKDLLFESNNTHFQVDTLLLSHGTCYLFEVKNFDGDFYIESVSDKWFTLSKTEVQNPWNQLKRTETLFRRVLQELGYQTMLEPCIIFVNPHFHLYRAPIELPAVFHSQFDRFYNKLSMSYANVRNSDIRFAEKLVSRCLKESPFSRVPEYKYEDLKKGICCLKCGAFMTVLSRDMLVCEVCSFKEELDGAVLRSVEEYMMLFAGRELTTNRIYDWFNGIISKKSLRRILSRSFKHVGKGKASYYVH